MNTQELPDDCETIDLVMLQADIDDDSPENLAAFAESAMSAGALDCVLVPVLMKKGRPGTRVEVLATPESAEVHAARMLRETPTLGVRRIDVRRTALARSFAKIAVGGHPVAVKIAVWNGRALRAKAEFEHLRAVAAATGRTLDDVRREADARIAELLVQPSDP